MLLALVQIGVEGCRLVRLGRITERAGLGFGFPLETGIVAVEGIVAIVGDVILFYIDEKRDLLIFADE